MKHFFKDKKKMIFLSVLILVVLAACSSPRDPETGEILAHKLIGLDTTFGSQLDLGLFDGIIVWPIAQLINLVAKYSDAGIAITVVTMLLQAVTSVFSIKAQVSSQKMQMLQPEMQRIQQKYEGKTDDRSKMAMAQEMQQLYKKYDINPFGSILTMFLQFPLILGMWQGSQRAQAVVEGSFLGINLTNTPGWGISNGQWTYVLIFVLMIIFQFVSFKFPQWQQKQREKNSKVKRKEYANPKKNSGLMGGMNMMMYGNILIIGFLAFSWPISMSFYWLVSSIARVIQNIIINKYFIKD
ncbi:MAG: YidC/Oxa1 family membrane protein insertase [Erysipelotrichaceae bacterium]|nr:YidC/Oxa1 family membrane protein insertase [Erysipelotrichaceae bacterium]MCI9312122.1 YidC/Oxa1 family membrane protein insertase [Erysipelotrichaceae bacterium]